MAGMSKAKRRWIIAVAVVVALGVLGNVIDRLQKQATPRAGPSAGPSSTSTSSVVPQPSSSSSSGPAGLRWDDDAAKVLTQAFAKVCSGRPALFAAPYAGRSHPIAIIGGSSPIDVWEDRIQSADEWPVEMKPLTVASVQLVACVKGHDIPDRSCGYYTRQSDGVSGEILLTRGVTDITVRVARTGAVLARKHELGEPATCNSQFGAGSDPPPWTVHGDRPNLTGTYQHPHPDNADYLIGITTRRA